MINIRPISNVVGVMLIVVGVLMLSALPFSFYYKSGDHLPILASGLVTILCGIGSWYYKFRASAKVTKREGYLIVALGWLSMAIFGMLPYLLSGEIPTITSAFFESVSGLTTTGASVLTDIESVPKGILFWRSMTQWIGGMGIIVLTVALFPLLGIGGVELFVAEAPGPTSDKIHPRIAEVAKRIWLIYVSLTGILMVILYFAGMNFYDAVNHGLTTMATGGFSTKNASMAHFDTPAIQYPIIFFMFLAGVNYTVIYYGLSGRFKKVWGSDEFKFYVLIIGVLITYTTITLWNHSDHSFEKSFRDSAFQVVSLITTTGFVSADYTKWTHGLTMLMFLLMFMGGCAGSTSGGIKLIRHLVFMKNSLLEFKRLLHPNAMIRIKIDKKVVAPRILTHILVFLLLYLIIFIVGCLIMTVILENFDQPFLTAIGAVGTSLGNVGPGIGQVGPIDNFAAIPALGKWVLSLIMLLGRLELFTILILFMPYFWRSN